MPFRKKKQVHSRIDRPPSQMTAHALRSRTASLNYDAKRASWGRGPAPSVDWRWNSSRRTESYAASPQRSYPRSPDWRSNLPLQAWPSCHTRELSTKYGCYQRLAAADETPRLIATTSVAAAQDYFANVYQPGLVFLDEATHSGDCMPTPVWGRTRRRQGSQRKATRNWRRPHHTRSLSLLNAHCNACYRTPTGCYMLTVGSAFSVCKTTQ